MADYTLYGDLADRQTIAVATVLRAKGLSLELIETSASLGFALAARGGREEGPFLRTPEGFVLADAHAILDWVERIHPAPPLLPNTPVRLSCARLLEDWIELWLPLWPRRSWNSLDRIGRHVSQAGFLLGERPIRVDWLLAAWLEAEVLVHEEAREHLARSAPRLTSYGADLLGHAPSDSEPPADDAIPISLLPLLQEIGHDYHAYLIRNHEALGKGEDSAPLDLGLGTVGLPVQAACERRRARLGQELRQFGRGARRAVERVLDPVHAWHALTLPAVLEDFDPADPRSL